VGRIIYAWLVAADATAFTEHQRFKQVTPEGTTLYIAAFGVLPRYRTRGAATQPGGRTYKNLFAYKACASLLQEPQRGMGLKLAYASCQFLFGSHQYSTILETLEVILTAGRATTQEPCSFARSIRNGAPRPRLINTSGPPRLRPPVERRPNLLSIQRRLDACGVELLLDLPQMPSLLLREREQRCVFALEPLHFLCGHDDGRAAVHRIDDGDGFYL
jgi:hypothetical protein